MPSYFNDEAMFQILADNEAIAVAILCDGADWLRFRGVENFAKAEKRLKRETELWEAVLAVQQSHRAADTFNITVHASTNEGVGNEIAGIIRSKADAALNDSRGSMP